MKLLRGLLVTIVALAVGLGLVVVAARYLDGPLWMIAGGPLDTGEWVESQGLDWSFAADLPTLELQLLNPPRSRTVWMIHHAGALYIACGFMENTFWKQWPHEAFIDGRAVVRIDGRRYPVELVRSTDDRIRKAVLEQAARKYGVPLDEGEDGESVWVFRVDSRTRGPAG